MRRLLSLLAVGAVLAGCARDPLPQLLQVTDVAPRQVELGDRLEISGAGFPQGRTARLLFHGVVHRPGEDERSGVDVELDGEVAAPDRIQIPVNEDLLAHFCGAGVHASHGTFEGAVEVVFAASTPAAPPVTGSLAHLVLDVLPPSLPRARLDATTEEGTRFLEVSGIRLTPNSGASSGLVIASVEPGSAAERAGLLPDDVILAASGVRASALSDLAPPPTALHVPLAVRRGGAPREEIYELALAANAVSAPRRFALPATLVASLALLLFLGFASPGRFVPWLRRRVRDVLRSEHAPRALLPKIGGPASAWAMAAFATALVLALPIVGASLDVGILALSLWLGRAALAISTPQEMQGAVGARGALHALAQGLPSFAVALGVVLTTGSLRADEVLSVQGGAPWEFAAFRSPAHLAMALIFLALPVLPVAAGRPPRHAKAAVSPFAGAGDWFASYLHVALAVTLFFGGFRIPGTTDVHTHGSMQVLAGALMAGKTWVLFAAVALLRAALPAMGARRATLHALRIGLPAAVVASLGARLWDGHVMGHALQAGTSFALVTLTLGAAALVAGKPRAAGEAALDPFL